MTIDAASSTQSLIQFEQDFIAQVGALNAQYLGISVSIILAAGGLVSILMYLLNFKPFQEKLVEQEGSIKQMSDAIKKNQQSNEKRISDLISNEEKRVTDLVIQLNKMEAEYKQEIELQKSEVKAANLKLETDFKAATDSLDAKSSQIQDKLDALEVSAHRLEVKMIWDAHYMWDSYGKTGVPYNSLRYSVDAIEKSLDYKITASLELYMKAVNSTLDKIDREQAKSSYALELRDRIVRLLPRLQIDEKLKSEVHKKANEILPPLQRA